ncbi:SDR family oxidoreductase [Roseiterribacter gracilis]|uniref:NAD(P)H-binding protein n=1 Tax=Roseiterribacter gracilis TaxID=2812848 RepID=A0A8S8XIA4_9PROT|nr:NAD(P)H-binding protein [Rhodospirillales bacterium TMPK1]
MTRILLTGATGLIGSAALLHGLRDAPEHRWTCLVRGDSTDVARRRLATQLAKFVSTDAAQDAAGKVDIIAGDLGTIDTVTHPVLDECTHILHLAADTSWWGKRNNWLVNYDGTIALARRARQMPHLKRFLHVGTAMICGGESPRLVQEDMFPADEAKHLVNYTTTKAATETMLEEEFDDLPIVVARPSIVVGHTELGASPSASIFWMFRAGDHLRLVAGARDASIDVVPIDWTAATLVGLLHRPQLQHRIYHLSAGNSKRTVWSDVEAAFARYDGEDRTYQPFCATSDRSALRRAFSERFGLKTPVQAAMLRAMQQYYRFCALGVVFDNQRLLDEGFAPPPALPEYLDVCLDRPNGISITDQFADDLGMFDRAAA